MAPAQAALLDFSFATESGGTGSFTLDTDTPPASDPAITFNASGAIEEGVAYLNAISDFSFSAPDTDIYSPTADFSVFPSIPFNLPGSKGVESAVDLPSGCVVTTDSFCSLDIPVVYSGNVSELPKLSTDPRSYPAAFDAARFTETGEFLGSDRITSYQAVPEPNSVLGTLALGIGGAGLLLKRKLNRKGPGVTPLRQR